MVFDFKEQLTIGAAGEEAFRKLYPKLEKADGIKFDFAFNGKTVELKTDTYAMNKTQNFFMEKYSSIESKKLGGPWRAAKDKVNYFVYMYSKDQKCFWFDSIKLADFLDIYVKEKKPRQSEVVNTSWTAMGYLVPRKDVAHLVIGGV